MRKLLGVLAVAALLIAGCGGGDDDNGENASANSDTTEAPSSGGGGGGDARFCGARAGFEALNQQGTPDANALKTAAENIDKAADAAPSEIKADVRTVVDASKPFFELLASVNYDFTKLMSDQSKAQEFQAIGAKMSEDKVEQAAERVNAWVEAHCK